jgi:hypothetical protein
VKKLLLPAFLAALAAADPVAARLVTFDLIPDNGTLGGPIPQGWASFTWSSNFSWVNGAAGGGGYQAGMVSAPNVAVNGNAAASSFRRNTPFQLVSFYLTSAWKNGLEVTVTGFRNDVEVNSATFTLSDSAPTLETLDWDVNRVTFKPLDKIGTKYNQFALDNLTTMPLSGSSPAFASVAAPEGSTWIMMLLGFGGLGFAGRRAPRTAQGVHLSQAGPDIARGERRKEELVDMDI